MLVSDDAFIILKINSQATDCSTISKQHEDDKENTTISACACTSIDNFTRE